jgi:ElaB/YqjD/DUF883 family membrane-anchored ribosome-binding protein
MLNETMTRNARSDAEAQDYEARTTEQLATKAHRTVDRLAATARGAETNLRGRAAELSDEAREQEARIRAVVDAGSRRAKAYLLKNPLLGIGAAFGAGALLAALLLRRSL